jgi:hypothetical protein
VIALPTDSVILEGRQSLDPDGQISKWLWAKISGPASFTIVETSDSVTMVKALVAGIYHFELKVTDNGGLSAKDTMSVIVDSVPATNHPPVADAGVDQTISIPANIVSLDGSGSTDVDNNISSYMWTRISGPSTFSISNENAVHAQVADLLEGIYEFELKVTDAGALFSKDTVRLLVSSASSLCHVKQTPIGALSIPRYGVQIAASGNKILFAGGFMGTGAPIFDNASSRVDIYDIITGAWSITELSIARRFMGVISSHNKIFFAGGSYDNNSYSTRVDIYDVSANTWSTAELSEPRICMAATAGDKILFAGGTAAGSMSARVDIYDLTTNTWSTASLSEPSVYYSLATVGKKILFSVGTNIDTYDASNGNWSTVSLSQLRKFTSPAVLGSKVYFAGGESSSNVVSNVVDIYDDATNSWSNTSMHRAKYALTSIATGNKLFWAGGVDSTNILNDGCNNDVEIYDVNTGIHSFHELLSCFPKPFVVNNKIVFFYEGHPRVDMYNLVSQSWSRCDVVSMSSVISVSNNIYGTGGFVNGNLTNQVWKIEF